MGGRYMNDNDCFCFVDLIKVSDVKAWNIFIICNLNGSFWESKNIGNTLKTCHDDIEGAQYMYM